jgi:hypothetical protein
MHATLLAVSAGCSTDDSDLMAAPVDLPREEAEVFFSEEKLHQDEDAPGAHVDNPTGGRTNMVVHLKSHATGGMQSLSFPAAFNRGQQ